MSKNKSEYIGIDVGGSKILLETFSKTLKLQESARVKTQTKKGKQGFTDQLYELIDAVFHSGIKGIGVAVPGIVDVHTGTLVQAPHLPTGKNFPLKKLLEKRYKKRVLVDNDINAFLVAEKERKELKKAKNIVAVMVGTGVGGAIIINGKLVHGKDGYAGEVGHMVIDNSSRRKTLEQNAGGLFFPKIGKKHALESLGIGLANLNLIFNPDVFILGGSVYINEFATKKVRLKKIISAHSLNKKAPRILDALSKTSVAKGIVMLMV